MVYRGLFLGWWAIATVALLFSASTYADTLAKIKASGEFVIGHRETVVPFSYIDKEGRVTGFAVDLCLRAYEQAKKQLARKDIKVRYVALKPADRIPAVKEGRVDVECSSTTNTVARQKDAAFSNTFFVAGARLLTKKSLKINEVSALRGKKISVSGGTTTEKLLTQFVSDRSLGAQIVVAKDTTEAFKMLAAGTADVAAGDDAVLVGMATQFSDPGQYDFVGKYLSVEPYGIMFRKDDAVFGRLIDSTLNDLFISGEFKTIYGKWFESGALKLPMNQFMKENVRLPNKYGVQ